MFKEKINLVFRKVISLLLTFYTSYLFVHFVILNAFTINNTLIIVVNIWFGHLVLNLFTLMVIKNRTFGDLFVGIKYQKVKNNMWQASLLAVRSILTTTLFYLIVYCNYLLGFPLYAVILTFISAFVFVGYTAQISGMKLSAADWLSGTIAVKN
ncbi:MAG: hypothetical protein ACPGTQ_09365 [Colwellia sp.]